MCVSDPQNDLTTKRRVSISLDPAVIPIGEALADEDRRSFSNLLEVLIMKEHARRSGKGAQRGQKVVA